MESVEQYSRYEISLAGPSGGNPFGDVAVSAKFINGHRSVVVRGFYDGEGVYKIRFMPDEPGDWQYETRSSSPELSGKNASFSVTAASGGSGRGANHGPVHVVGSGFAYADGTPYVPIGTTAYAWVHQPKGLRNKTIKTLAENAFTKIRMCVFPKDYRYNRNEPECFAFPGSLADGFDLTRFDPAFFQMLEEEIDHLMELGVEADLILFHPYDRWGFQSLPEDVEARYLQYVIARLASFRNLWWSMANEWDFMRDKNMQDFHRYFRIVQREDPYDHLRSVHNGFVLYDHALPWVTHASMQRHDTERCAEWLDQYKKPIVIDECCYEGDITEGWGNISGQELMRRQWTAVIHGGWPGAHGETYYNDDEVLWWSKGGMLTGEAPKRIAFMHKILTEAPVQHLKYRRADWDLPCLACDDDYLLFYLGFQQASWKDIQLPNGKKYQIDIVDTWAMTVNTIEGTFSGEVRVPLPGKEYMAIRARAV